MIGNESVIIITNFSWMASDFWPLDQWMSFTFYEDVHGENAIKWDIYRIRYSEYLMFEFTVSKAKVAKMVEYKRHYFKH
jgi:hypothetical protein